MKTTASRRSTDEAFLKLITVNGSSLLKLLGLPAERAGDYRFHALVLKEKRLEPDVVGFPIQEDAQGRIFLEFHGYKDPFIRHRQVAKALISCAQEKYQGPVFAGIIYTHQKYQDAALPLNTFAGLEEWRSQCSGIREIVLSNYTEAELLAIDPKLVVLAPFTLSNQTDKVTILAKSSQWKTQVENTFPEEQQPDILNVLGLFILHKFRRVNYEEVMTMLRFDLMKSVAGRQVYQMGQVKASQDMVIQAIKARFGIVPKLVRDQMRLIKQPIALKYLLNRAILCASLDSFIAELPAPPQPVGEMPVEETAEAKV